MTSRTGLAALPVRVRWPAWSMWKRPSRVSICSSVAVIAELVAGGIGMGLLPERMADRYVAEGSMRRLRMIPPVEDGRLFVGTRQGYEDERGAAVVRTISQVLDRIGYLRAAA